MKKSIIFVSGLMCLAACSSNDNSTTQESTEAQAVTADSSVVKKSYQDATKYKLPSPVELYLIIREANAKFNLDALHNNEDCSKYVTSDSKAINFGIYASDLAYCTVFEKQQETHSLFKTLKTMASDLGITEGFSAEIVNRLDKNLYNSDSLYQITNDSYWEACEMLEETGNSNILSKILLGGWVESLYLAIQSVDKFDANSELTLSITEQSYLLENLIDYISNMNDESNDQYLEKLNELQYSFDKLYDNPDGVLITPAQYKEIAKRVAAFRNELIK